jgi:hypothetical protein
MAMDLLLECAPLRSRAPLIAKRLRLLFGAA